MNKTKHISKLHFITQDVSDYAIPELVKLVCEGGVDWVQLRAKNLHDEWKEIAQETLRICTSFGAILIINDNVEIAYEIGAGGVHLGKADMPPSEARKILGTDFIIGGTANTQEDIKAIHEHVDYIGLGPFRFTETKENLSPVLGLEGYNNIKSTKPIIAIGGIKKEDVNSLLETGIHGVAVSSAIAKAEEVQQTTKEFLKLLPSSGEDRGGSLPSLEGLGVGKSRERRKILPYNPKLKERARELRNNSTLSEILLWKKLKGKQMRGFDFDRQRPISNFIVDFYCKDLMLAIEIDGSSHNHKFLYDARRHQKLESLGVTVLHFTDKEVKQDMNNVLRAIDILIDETGLVPYGTKEPTPKSPPKRGLKTQQP